MEKQTTDHSKYYWETDRNGWTQTTTNNNEKTENMVNPKMKMSKEELGLNKIPKYYKGKEGYEARRVCDNFDLPYHLATATTYILRAYHKHKSPVECITKAIAHLEFELDKINRNA